MLKKSLSYVMLLKVAGNFVADKDLICHLSYKVNLTSKKYTKYTRLCYTRLCILCIFTIFALVFIQLNML